MYDSGPKIDRRELRWTSPKQLPFSSCGAIHSFHLTLGEATAIQQPHLQGLENSDPSQTAGICWRFWMDSDWEEALPLGKPGEFNGVSLAPWQIGSWRQWPFLCKEMPHFLCIFCDHKNSRFKFRSEARYSRLAMYLSMVGQSTLIWNRFGGNIQRGAPKTIAI